jgi:hypothetical protein
VIRNVSKKPSNEELRDGLKSARGPQLGGRAVIGPQFAIVGAATGRTFRCVNVCSCGAGRRPAIVVVRKPVLPANGELTLYRALYAPDSREKLSFHEDPAPVQRKLQAVGQMTFCRNASTWHEF